jgi:hypothetical protein
MKSQFFRHCAALPQRYNAQRNQRTQAERTFVVDLMNLDCQKILARLLDF